MEKGRQTQRSSASHHLNHNHDLPIVSGTDKEVEKTAAGDVKLTLSEEAALEHARASPDDNKPLYICFARDDRDSPRNFSKARKWYISIFAAWLNFLL